MEGTGDLCRVFFLSEEFVKHPVKPHMRKGGKSLLFLFFTGSPRQGNRSHTGPGTHADGGRGRDACCRILAQLPGNWLIICLGGISFSSARAASYLQLLGKTMTLVSFSLSFRQSNLPGLGFRDTMSDLGGVPQPRGWFILEEEREWRHLLHGHIHKNLEGTISGVWFTQPSVH